MRVLFLVLLLGPRFDGCGSADDSSEAPLPRSDVEVCFGDADCESAECEDVRCLAGTCTLVSDFLDRDGDGDAPIRCGGTDCNDRDRRVFPGARETCDGVDEDCDMRIDEDAPDQTVEPSVAVFDPVSVIIPWGESFALTDNQPGAIFAWPVSLEGVFDDPVEIMRLRRGSAYREIDAATNGEDTIVFAVTDSGAVNYAITRDAGVIEEGDLDWEGQVVDLSVAPHLDDFAVGVDTILPEEPDLRRFVRTRRDAEPVDVGTSAGFVDLASTGDDVAIVARFGFQLVGTSEIVSLDRPIQRPLASSAARVAVAFDDGFGIALQYFDASGPLGSPQPGPVARPDASELVATAEGVALLGRSDFDRGVWVLDETLTRYVRTFVSLGIDDGAMSTASRGSAHAFYGAGTSDPRLTITRLCE